MNKNNFRRNLSFNIDHRATILRRKLYWKLRKDDYDLTHRLQAMSILKSVEDQKGTLNPKYRALCDAYAVDVLKNKGYAPWLYVYAAVAGTFKDGWVPDNYYGRVVVPHLKGDYGAISSLKPLSPKLFASDCFPDLGAYVNGMFLDPTFCPVDAEQFRQHLFS